MYCITEMANELRSFYSAETAPLPVYNDDYVKFIIRAIKKFYVDINHPEEYDQNLIITDEQDNKFYDHDFMLDEEEYRSCHIADYFKIKNEQPYEEYQLMRNQCCY